ncbi:MAG TPA: hypothetical protein VM554_10360 [Acidisarcina sp.]|nr:hypothetical protein [Acidisarcina sp.]
MNFLNMFLRGLAVLPGMIQGVESFVGNGNGDQKKAAALSMVGSAINLTDAIANKHVLDPAQFQGGLGKVIDGIVDCLNSSAWSKL